MLRMTTDDQMRHLLARVTAELHDTRNRLRAAEDDAAEPIAIVGMACRFPGSVTTSDELWELVRTGTDAISEFPADRGWDLDELYDADADAAGKSYVRHGGFLRDASAFDAAFFGISPREATAMDPQQRLLLETSWEAVENAGIAPGGLRGSRTGVFAGTVLPEYGPPLREPLEGFEGYFLTGKALSVVSGRVAYSLGLEGPAVTVDTACSSSLVAMHLACQSLRSGESTLALAGGVTVMASPGIFIEFSRQRGLAKDGRCKAFSADADGTGWAEGAGVVVLERLSDARRNGHHVLAVVRGSAVNQDGASNGLTAPNGPSQVRVIQEALANAGLTPADVDAVEAHGTGTSLGDPIEAQALLATYGKHHTAERPLWLGSLKSNIGHTQAAAGVAGVIKTVQALNHEELPATLHAGEASPHIDWSSGSLALLTEPQPWPETGRPRRAAVSSFGVSGTNAHLILEQAPQGAAEPAEGAETKAGVLPWLISARTPEALEAQAERLHAHLRSRDGWMPAEVARSLATTRTHFPHRAAIIGADRQELLSGLEAIARAETSAAVTHGASVDNPGIAMLLSGQGSQRPGMGRGLHEAFPVFAQAWDEACAHLDPLLGLDRPLTDIVFHGQPAEVEQTLVAQPALFVLQVALFRLLEQHGVGPDYLIGHSIGELTAAHLAGVLTLADAATLLAARAKLMQNLPAHGVMAGINASEQELTEAHPELLDARSGVSVAAVNGPLSTVVSGDPGPVQAIAGHWRDQGRTVRNLHTSRAFHSPHCEPLLGELERTARELTFHPSKIPIISTVTGTPTDDITTPAYWARQVRTAVRFAPALAWLHQNRSVTHHLELGPDATLTTLARATHDTPSHATLNPGTDDTRAYVTALANAHTTGLNPDWAALLPRSRVLDLPTYAFQHERYWLNPPTAGRPEQLGMTTTGHPLLTARITTPQTGETTLTGRVSLDSHPWLADHAVQGNVLLPGTAFLDMTLHAAAQLDCAVEELTLHTPLELPDHGHVALHMAISAEDDGRRTVALYSRAPGTEEVWTRHATGTLATSSEVSSTVDLAAWPPAGAAPVDVSDLYDRLADHGFGYGPAFQGLHTAWQHGDDIYADVALPDDHGTGGWAVHPALLDAAQHAGLIGGDSQDRRTRLVFSWSGVRIHGAVTTGLRVRLRHAGTDAFQLDLADHDGLPVATIESLALRRVSNAALEDNGLLRLDWVPQAFDDTDAPQSCWALIDSGVAALSDAVASGEPAPDIAVLDERGLAADDDVARRVGEVSQRVVAELQAWLAAPHLAGTRLVLVTRGAVAAQPGEVPDLVTGPLWGLLRVAQNEHPDRFVLVDTDSTGDEELRRTVGAALRHGEAQIAVRGDAVFVPRLVRADSRNELVAPGAVSWRLDVSERGSIDNLYLAEFPEAQEPLAAGQVRVAVRAVGVNFRDVLNTLGMYPGTPPLGVEGAGVITEVAGDVPGIRVGDRVWGVLPGSMGPLAVTDHRLLAPVPDGWSFAQAAATPAVFLTAYYALHHLTTVQSGQKVLVHAAAGGVGMAAVQLLQNCGADIYATAHPTKWALLRELGIPADHIASSRTPDFAAQFPPVDVVLNSLTGELLDASLDLLKPGGHFIELGKTDLRDPGEHPGSHFHAFDLSEIDPAHMQGMLADLTGLFERGRLTALPVTAWDIRQAPEAFRYLANARHIGKLALTVPAVPDPRGTILITGGTGALGSVLARHLAAQRPDCHLLLASRQGPASPNADALRDELGSRVTIATCDVTDPHRLSELIDSIPAEHPLTGVVHTAGVLHDAPLHALTSEQLAAVVESKVDSAWNLHLATQHHDLAFFVLYSSAAGIFGNPGQANYAAANTFLDALAQHRHTRGLTAQSLAWGPWNTSDGMTRHLTHADQQRMAGIGALPFDPDGGAAAFDAACRRPAPFLVPLRLDTSRLRDAPPILGDLKPRQTAKRRSGEANRTVEQLLDGLDDNQREQALLQVVRREAAAVLGHSGAESIPAGRVFLDLGFDSLTSVELRNRLATATGLRLPTTLAFDHPTPEALAAHLRQRLLPRAQQITAPARASASDEPIAIVGMACRLPGGVHSPDELWQLLAGNADAITAFPTNRGWNLATLFNSDPDNPGTSYARRGGFLHEADEFDAAFFGISPREAATIDPQQRLLLETSWEALEHARINPASLPGSRTGVFTGVIYQDYAGRLAGRVLPEFEGYLGNGSAGSIASGRVSYTFGLEGPAVTVDTACSSSLVAMHLACQSLRSGESALALAGGASVMATPTPFIEFSRQRGLAPDGRCKAFSADADGTGWAEGAGVVVLERLSDARRNGHRILAVIRGSAVNQDGASNGLTAPNGPSQERVILEALNNAGLTPADVDAVEAHGTGTSLGDPIEAQALLATYGQHHTGERPLWLGSLKSNIGHTQAAAGVAGVIKMIQALHHNQLPATLHADEPSSHVDWSSGALALLTKPQPWPEGDQPRRAAVSSFGVSGTNAHLILEQAPPAESTQDNPASAIVPWVFSAKSPEALTAQAERLHDQLRDRDDWSPAEVAWSLATTRATFQHRAAVLADDRQEFLAGLETLARSGESPFVARGVAAGDPSVAMLLSGQGSQRPGMGRGLHEAFPVFAAAWDDVCAHLDPLLGLDRPLTDIVFHGQDTEVEQTLIAQPALFALQVGLFRLLEHHGIRPDYLIGHSIGELTAAHLAGVLDLTDAATLLAARARLIQSLPAHGVMTSINASEQELTETHPELLDPQSGVSIAAINGPRSTVVSGGPDPVHAIAEHWRNQGRTTRELHTSRAFHSPHCEPILDELERTADQLTYHPPKIPIISTLTGNATDNITTPAYWARQVRQPVRFAPALAWLHQHHSITHHLELGPDTTLTTHALTNHDETLSLPTQQPGVDGAAGYLSALTHAHTTGLSPNWAAVLTPARTVDLPTYAFQRQSFWLDPPDDRAEIGSDAGFWTAVEDNDPGAVAKALDIAPETPLHDVVTALSAWRRRRRDEVTLSSWRYEVQWHPAPTSENPPVLCGNWLIISAHDTDREVLDTVKRAMTGAEAHPILIDDQPSRSELADLLRDEAPTGVVSLLGAVAATITLVQALGDAGVTAPLWCLTRGAVGVDEHDEPPNPDLAALWGLGRVIALEHPDRWGGLVDLPLRPDRRAAASLAAILSDRAEDQVAIRPAGAHVARLARVPATADSAWQPDEAVQVTGASPGVERLTGLLNEQGIATTSNSGRTVLHVVPGETATGLLATTDAADVEAELRRSITELARLDELLVNGRIETLVVLSAVTDAWGAEGFAAGAATSAWVDALVRRRRAAGLRVVSVEWGPWDGSDDVEAARRRGLLGMSPELAIASLRQAIGNDDHVVAVADVDWNRFVASNASRCFAGLADAGHDVAASSDEPHSALRERITGLPEKERRRAVMELVRGEVAAVLGHADPAAVPANRPLQELGFESLTAVQLRNRLAKSTGLRLSATLAFDHPTLTALADHVLGRLTPEAPVAAPATAQAAAGEDIAIVGMACRLPGGVDSPEGLWDLVSSRTDAITPFPANRGWDLAGIFDPDPDAVGRTYVRSGGFLHDAAAFDPEFFSISPREALAMDPQQRLLLETSWEALERAGLDPATLRSTPTGVFAGTNGQDYAAVLRRKPTPGELEPFVGTGTTASVLSGRIAYILGLEGPAVTVDTACSSSLVAMHLACQSLRSGESSLALAGGASIMATPDVFIEFSRQRGLAKDGRCKAFSASADGTSWSEGVGVVVLERLSDAQRNGHRVLAVVRGSAVNQDGASNGLTAPNGPSQERVILQALANAGLTPADVDAVEAHGTGTSLGDPIEAQALLATYGRNHTAERPLLLGSLKSNIGHAQAAAGVAGVIKTVQALNHEELPATLHADEPSPHIDWSSGTLALLTEPQPWPETGRPRRAAVSSFGVSGTNAHLILEQPSRDVERTATADPGGGLAPWVISAKTAEALEAQAEQLHSRLMEDPGWSPVEVAWSLATARSAFSHRAAVVGGDREELLTGLKNLPHQGGSTGTARGIAVDEPAVAMLLSGQGSQRPGMGRGLHETFPVFAQAWDEACEHLDPLLGLDRPLTDIVFHGQDTEVEQTLIAQPALFALQVALFRLLEHHGITPDYLIGHSIGELTAAHLAGVLDLTDAATLLATRARLMQTLPAHGAMTSINASEQELTETHPELLDPQSGVSIAAINSPQSTVISGEPAPVQAITDHWRNQGRTARNLHTSRAFHSPHCEPLLAEMERTARELTFHQPKIPIISTVTGTPTDDLTTPAYWARQMRQAVRFAPALTWLHQHHAITHHLELGPDATLTTLARTAHDTPSHATLEPGTDDTTAYLTALTHAHTTGLSPDWAALLAPARTLDLPTYPFQRRDFWASPQPSSRAEDLGFESTGHPLLSARIDVPQTGQVIFTGQTAQDAPLTRTAALDMALHAASRLGHVLDELTIHNGFRQGRTVLQLVATPGDNDDLALTLHSRCGDDDWALHASGRLRSATPEAADIAAVDLQDFYDEIADGEAHQAGTPGLQAAWHHDGPTDVQLDVVDETGLPVAAVRLDLKALTAGPADPDRLFRLVWRPLAQQAEAVDLGLIAPGQDLVPDNDVVVIDQRDHPAAADIPALVGRRTQRLLDLVQAWLGQESGSRLVLLTRNAVTVHPGEAPDLGTASLWGLLRPTQTEHPDRILLMDVDDPDAAPETIGRAVATALHHGEQQVAIRDGELFAQRLAPAEPGDGGSARGLDPRGTVLITGGTGALGSLVARHLAAAHHGPLLLVSRQGPAASGAEQLLADLVALGADAEIAACDLTDPAALAGLLESIPGEHPLTGVIHTAGVLRDAPVHALRPDDLTAVLAPKVTAAWNLHEATRRYEPDVFVLFSSAVAIFGNPGQANYAAANAFLDALAQHRGDLGLPAHALAWGPWQVSSGMSTDLSEVNLARMTQAGIVPLQPDDGLRLFDEACRTPSTHLLPLHLDATTLRAYARANPVPPLLTEFLPPQPAQRSAAEPLHRRLAGMPETQQLEALLELVRDQVAGVLGHTGRDDVPEERPFLDLGFDSLTAVELRNRITAATDLPLATTLVFDHPTPAKVAALLHRKFFGEPTDIPPQGGRPAAEPAADIDAMDVESLVQKAFESSGR
ncbi:SDR family NAD(P)-dependent oxidoreductase [Saccharopolyspora shandongensis]|uniref:SDR family NAD(P)-dependent oxidoreductase n=1 Tax=Saccharopolyspora shandongensis TaxID=418495 RepID=UPI003F4E29AA